jgi:hypothetical protein
MMPTYKITVLGLSPGKDVFCSSEAKHNRRTAPKAKTPGNFPVDNNVETNVLGFRDYIFMISNDRPERLIRKSKHFSNFPAVKLWAL